MCPKPALHEDKESITNSQKGLSPKSLLKAFHSTFLRREEKRLIPISIDERCTSGFCKTSLSFFGSYQDTYLELEDTYLSISMDQSKRRSVLKTIHLVGASLEVLSSTKITISNLEGRYWFKFTNGLQCSQWLNAFQCISGLQKCLEDFYEIGGECGQGRSCVVYECFSKLTRERFALKELIDPFDEIGLIGLHNELHILQLMMKHPHDSIPRLHDSFRTKNGLQLIVEFLPGGELSSKIEKQGALDEDQAREIFKSVIGGVRHLHENCIAHRDLKPANIMLSDVPRIIDFDLALVNYSETWFGCHLCGTPEFMAPEILRGETYSQSVDLWSLGCVLFAMLFGYSPFKGATKQETKSNILNFKFDRQELEKVSHEARDLILKMLEMCDEERITIQQVMEHPWIKSSN